MAGELLEFENGTMGQVFNLEEDSIGAVIFGNYLEHQGRRHGQDAPAACSKCRSATRSSAAWSTRSASRSTAGPPITSTETRKMDIVAPGIAERQPVNEPLQTGIKAIDSMIPIGRGQRELIIGDRKTGKTAIAHRHDHQPEGQGREVLLRRDRLRRNRPSRASSKCCEPNGAMEYTTVVVATAADPAPLQYIAAYAGCAMAEYFMWKGEHTLCVYDDLSKQAAAYRQLSPGCPC